MLDEAKKPKSKRQKVFAVICSDADEKSNEIESFFGVYKTAEMINRMKMND